MTYEEEEQLRELLKKKYEDSIMEELDFLIDKYKPHMNVKIEQLVLDALNPNKYTQANTLLSKKAEEVIRKLVDEHLRLWGGPAPLMEMIHKVVDEKIQPTIEMHVQSLLNRRVEAALKVLSPTTEIKK